MIQQKRSVGVHRLRGAFPARKVGWSTAFAGATFVLTALESGVALGDDPPPLPASSSAPSVPTAVSQPPPGYAPVPGAPGVPPVPGAPGVPPVPGRPYYAPAPGVPPQVAPPSQSGPAPILPWEPGAPVPDGYRPQSRPTSALLGVGIGLLSAGWVTAVVTGGVMVDDADKSGDPNAPAAGTFVPMFFPVAGPFITMAVWKPGPAEMGLLITDGIFQVAGAAGVLAGALKQTHRLVYVGPSEATLRVEPVLGLGYVGISGSF
ncbi:MAG: hypothetical protein IPK82_20655 [Polyangiaceae bacterium]|nr:hypothetical protein [Polyangiaceae bacterium]